MIKSIVFDLDGTLLDTLDDLYASVNHALTTFGMPTRSKDEVRMFLGNGIHRLVKLSVPKGCPAATTEQVLAELRAYYLKHSLDSTQPYAGIEAMLNDCRKRGYTTAIVSNKLNPAVQDLHRQFFPDNINVAIGETKELKRKPAPDMVLKALELLHSNTDEAVYVGDSEVDLVTACNASLPCIAVAWGFRGREFLEQKGAETIIDSPSDLIMHLNKN